MKSSFTLLSFLLCTLFCISTSLRLPAQNCGCDHTLSGLNPISINIIDASNFSYVPGDVFCIDADTIAGLRLIGFQGSASQPLIFKNCNGRVVIRETTYSGIAFRGSQYVHLTGTGDAAQTYGIKVMESGGGQMGVSVGSLSSDFEIDHVEIHHTGFAGIMAKTDPNCSDTLTWRRNGYILRNLDIHHNFIHDTEGEGMYLGYTGGYRVVSNKVCSGDTVFGHWLEDVEVHDNILENTGWDAIQLNLGRSGCSIHDNFIRNPGVEQVTFQDFAMSVGGGTYEIYNNYILNDPGQMGKGMQMISGQSGCKIFNNVFIDLKSFAAFLHPRHEYDDPNLGYAILNNTVVRPGGSAFLYNSTITTSYNSALIGTQQDAVPMAFHNNLVVNPDCDYASGPTWKDEPECYFDFNNKSTRDSQVVNIAFNLPTRRMDTLLLTDTLNNDYSPQMMSALVDAGMDLSNFGVTFDHRNIPRPQLSGYDIGAYEYAAPLITPEPEEEPRLVYPNPNSGRFHLEVPVSEIRVWNAWGESRTFYPPGREVNLGEAAAGVYWLRLVLENGDVAVRKVVVVR